MVGRGGFFILCGAVTLSAQPLDIGDRRQLFIDRKFVESTRGVELRVHTPRKTGEITIPWDPAWELGGRHAVIEKDGVYHLWCTAGAGAWYAHSSDGIHWERPDPSLAKAPDPPGPDKNEVFPYPWADGVYFMFPALYYRYGDRQREFSKESPVDAGTIDVRFAASRDGASWEHFGRQPFVRLGMDGEFDSKRIHMVNGMVPAMNGRELYMYYMGTNEPHGWNRDKRNNRILFAAGVAPNPPRRAISRVVLRRDGFVSVSAPYAGGEFTTPPLKFRGSQLVLNLQTYSSGEVRVEIQDESGRPMPGFALSDADLIHSANEIDRPVSWKGVSAVDALASKTIRLRIVLRDADLYAFQFRDRPAF